MQKPLKIYLSILTLVVAVLLYANLFRQTPPYQLSIVAIFQNEAPYLKEWIDFHRLLGVDHFVLFNHLSHDEFKKTLTPYLEKGVVELIDWPYPSREGSESDWTRIQTAAYTLGIEQLKEKSTWVAILDTDEFLFPVEAKNLPLWLAGYPTSSGILVNWQVFGTGGVKKLNPERLLIDQLHMRSDEKSPMNTYCKSVFRPERVLICKDPHHMGYYPWFFAIDPNQNLFAWKHHFQHAPVVDKVRINHYWARDEAFFQERKLARYKHWGTEKETLMTRNEAASLIVDHTIDRFADLLKGKK